MLFVSIIRIYVGGAKDCFHISVWLVYICV